MSHDFGKADDGGISVEALKRMYELVPKYPEPGIIVKSEKIVNCSSCGGKKGWLIYGMFHKCANCKGEGIEP